MFVFEVFQLDVAVVVDGVVAMHEPVADIYIGGFVAVGGKDFPCERGVAVAEYAIVKRLVGKPLAAI